MGNDEGSIEERLEGIIDSDDKDSFVKLLEAHPEVITKSLLEKCAEFGAKECLLALLQGDHPPPPTLDEAGDSDGITALAYAAHSCPDPLIFELMLNKCNAYSQLNVSSTIGSVHGFPIDFVLFHLSYLEPLYYWGRGDSLIKLVILLCTWKTKLILDSVRLLADCTQSINKIAWTFVMHGALKQFAALLLVSREKVMASFDTGFTIRQCLTAEIDSLSEGHIGSQLVEYRNMLTDAVKLLDLFEIAGDALSSYCSSMHEYVEIIQSISDVCEVLKKRKVFVGPNDLKLHNFFEGEDISCLDYSKLIVAYRPLNVGSWLHFPPTGEYTLQYEDGSLPSKPSSAIEQYEDNSSPWIQPVCKQSYATQQYGDESLSWLNPIWKPSFATQGQHGATRHGDRAFQQYGYGLLLKSKLSSEPYSATQLRWMSSRACHARKISKPLEHVHVNHSLVQLARITMKLKKGLAYM